MDIRKWPRGGAAIALACALSGPALAAEPACQPVRPAGLNAAQVDGLVLQKVAQALDMPAEHIDPRKSLADLAAAPDRRLVYALTMVGIGEGLAVDPVQPFEAAAKRLGRADAMQLPITALQQASRDLYFAGHDTPPPPARPGATYTTPMFAAKAPARPTGWTIARCNHDEFMFKWKDPGQTLGYVAVAREISIHPFRNVDGFVAQMRDEVKGHWVAPGMRIEKMDVRWIGTAAMPCVAIDLSMVADAASPPLVTTMRGKTCYRPAGPHRGFTALVARTAHAPDDAAMREVADPFIAAATLLR